MEEEQSTAKEAHEWQRSVEPPYCVNFAGRFGDDSAKIAVETMGNERKLTTLSQQSFGRSHAVPGDMGLVIGGGLVIKDLEERIEKISTSDAYANVANRMVAVRVSCSSLHLLDYCLAEMYQLCFVSQALARLSLLLNRTLRTEEQVIEQGRQIQQQGKEIEALKAQLVAKSSQHNALHEKFLVHKSAMGVLKADNKALREKLDKVIKDQETTNAARSVTAVET
ncbi:hypothetical protein AXF42_Ash003448 [Apostasia shenzhenica]|uniref:Uncharacterized protein n=1 Tax=Apostasia shenzhenica TaxID=1088818 RepID=A0A2I0BG92_9ASPA|nr:hypothetical protein AXF42_Ash003448 [Apostasia shenzhenica]